MPDEHDTFATELHSYRCAADAIDGAIKAFAAKYGDAPLPRQK